MTERTMRSRLPKWAQDEIARLEHNLADAERRAAARDAGQTGIVAGTYTSEMVHLDDDVRIVFTMPYNSRAFRPAEIEIKRDGEELSIRAREGGIIVWPVVSNVVRIGAERQEPRD